MDESWNFLIEAPDEEFSLLTNALIESSISFSSKDSRESLIRIVCDNVGPNIDSYGQYIEKVCYKCWINTEGKTISEKEKLLLDHIISIELDNKDEVGLQQFSKQFNFASQERESLKTEVLARSCSSIEFLRKLPSIAVSSVAVSAVGSTLLATSGNLFDNRNNNGKSFHHLLAITAILIQMSQEYNSILDEDSSKACLDRIIRTDDTFENQKETAISVMRTLFKTFGNIESNQYQHAIDEVSILLQGHETPIPAYTIRKMENWYKSLLKYLMKRLFPLNDDEAGWYENSSKNLKGNKVVFFDYCFPYTKTIEGAYYARPIDKWKECVIRLFLVSNDVDVDAFFLSEKELRGGIYDFAVIHELSESEDKWCKDHCNNKPIVMTDAFSDGWESIIGKNIGVIELIREYFGLPLEDFKDGISEEMWSKAPSMYKKLRTEVLLPLYNIRFENEQVKKDNEERFRRLRHFSTPNIGLMRTIVNKIRKGKIDSVDFDNVLKQLDIFQKFISGFGKEEGFHKSVDLISEINLAIGIAKVSELFAIQKEYDENAKIGVLFMKEEINEVLTNIFENIKTHAFSSTFKKKNKVIVRIVNAGSLCTTLYIINNGIPFKGDTEKVFEKGQVYGEYGNSGEGLYRAKTLMNKYGGTIAFISEPDKEFCVSYKLTFQNYKQQILT